MKIKALVYLLVWIIGGSAFAETKYLLVDPGTSPTSNYYRYYNDIRRAYETLVSQGKQPQVFAKNGKWILAQHQEEKLMKFGFDKTSPDYSFARSSSDISYPPISGSARNIQDFTKSIKDLNLKDGDSVVFYITAHGGSPADPAKPETATISAWKSEVSFDDFGKALEMVPKGIKIKLITTTCYGGGIHAISRRLDNVWDTV